MGAWGYKPFDNDSAMDWLGPIETHILTFITEAFTGLKRVEQVDVTYGLRKKGDKTRSGKRVQPRPKLRGSGQHEAIAAAALLAELSKSGSLPNLAYEAHKHGTFDRAIEIITSIQRNDAWIDEWNDPRAMRVSLSKLISTLTRRALAQTKLMERVKSRIVIRHTKRTHRKPKK